MQGSVANRYRTNNPMHPRSRNEDIKKPDTRKKLRVLLRRSGNQWQASVADLSASGHNTRTARRLIAALIEERYGRVAFEVEIELPKGSTVAVRRYREDEQRLRELAESVPLFRLQCIHELLAMNLSQEEVASMLGMTRSHLAVALKRAQTRGSVPTVNGRGRSNGHASSPPTRAASK
jgi:hypothetical protein